jgi:hypothetical protein
MAIDRGPVRAEGELNGGWFCAVLVPVGPAERQEKVEHRHARARSSLGTKRWTPHARLAGA